MSELSMTVQNLDNKIKTNKSKEDYLKGEIKKHMNTIQELESMVKNLTESNKEFHKDSEHLQ